MFQAELRDRIVASLRSKDSDSLIFGFRQMLKGICDGELLLDSQLQVCGKAACLQRLLMTPEDFVGRPLPELIDGEEAVKKFEKFLAATPEESAETPESAPRCLRVPLRAPSGRLVSVDVCHVPLPQLYGAKSLHHLLSLTEDIEVRELPQAPVQPVELNMCNILAGEEATMTASVRSGTSSENHVENFDELKEVTLVLNASTELIDIEEAHLRFERHTSEAKLSMCMPSLKRFARPLDWPGLETFLRQYARQAVSETFFLQPTQECVFFREAFTRSGLVSVP